MTYTPAFRPGQRIKALHSSYDNNITEGIIYTVRSVDDEFVICRFDDEFVICRFDNGGVHAVRSSRFVPCYDSVFESDLYAYLDEELL